MLFQPVLLGDNTYELCITPMYEFPKHWHADIEILYCIQGSFNVGVEKNVYTLKKHSIILVGSSEVHEVISPSGDAKAVSIRLGSLFCGKSVFNEIVKRRFEMPVIEYDEEIKNEAEQIMSLYLSEKTYINELEIHGRIYKLLTLLLKKLRGVVFFSEEHQIRLKMMMRIQKALDIVSAKYNEKISIDDVAYASGYEKGSFCRIFKNATGSTFHKYLNDYRIKKAILLLEDNHYSMAEISDMIGFSQQKKFSTIFKESVGVTPTQYRKMYLMGDDGKLTECKKITIK